MTDGSYDDDRRPHTATDDDPGLDASTSLRLIGAGIGVFIICSIVQAIGGSHMFTMSFEDPDNFVVELAMQLTWWPGWLATIGLIGVGIFGLVVKDS